MAEIHMHGLNPDGLVWSGLGWTRRRAMCECLEYADGEMHLCVVCADEWREREEQKENDRKHMRDLENRIAELEAQIDRLEANNRQKED